MIHIGRSGQRRLKGLQPEIDFLKEKCTFAPNAFLFSPTKAKAVQFQNKGHINRSKFNVLINSVLVHASTVLQKTIRSHSFRSTYITDLLSFEVPIHRVKELIGHKNITTTARYNRSVLTKKELQKTVSHLNKFRNQEKIADF